MSYFLGAMGGLVMASLTVQVAARGRRLSLRRTGLIGSATFVLATPLFALLFELLPPTGSIWIILGIAVLSSVVEITGPKERGQLRAASSSTRFRILMYVVAPAAVLTLFVAVALVFPDVPKLPMIAGGITGVAILLVLAASRLRGDHEN